MSQQNEVHVIVCSPRHANRSSDPRNRRGLPQKVARSRCGLSQGPFGEYRDFRDGRLQSNSGREGDS